MTRVLAIAITGALIFAPSASAVPYHLDVSETGSATFNTTGFPSVPSAPCTNGAAGYFLACPFSRGSSLELDITGSMVTITSGTIEIDTKTDILFGTAFITTDQTVSLSGGYGTLTGDDIVWTSPAAYTVAGTFTCTGPNCGFAGLPNDLVLPIGALLYWYNRAYAVNPIQLGTWHLNASLDSILASTRSITAFKDQFSWTNAPGDNPNTPAGSPMSWMVFGPQDLGAAPEPGASLLVLVGLCGLVVRSHMARSLEQFESVACKVEPRCGDVAVRRVGE